MHGRRARTTSLATVYMASLLAIVLALAACGGSNAPTAQQLIKNAQAAIQKVKSYHFNLVVDNPGEGGVLTIKTADGDVLVPDKLQAKANALVFGSVVNVRIIAIGDKQYVTDPITGSWMAASGLLDPRTLSDSKTGSERFLVTYRTPVRPPMRMWTGRPAGISMAHSTLSTWLASLAVVHQQAPRWRSLPV